MAYLIITTIKPAYQTFDIIGATELKITNETNSCQIEFRSVISILINECVQV